MVGAGPEDEEVPDGAVVDDTEVDGADVEGAAEVLADVPEGAGAVDEVVGPADRAG